MPTIESIDAFEILDSRGNPTLSVTVRLNGGAIGNAHVPSGASTGKHEAVELRDGDPARYDGKGVLKAVSNVRHILGPSLKGVDWESQRDLDQRMIAVDGTENKSRLGANSLLGVSCAYARAVAALEGKPLWASLPLRSKPRMPIPMVNIISGGLHAGGQIEVQDFLVIPHGFERFSEALEAVVRIHGRTRKWLSERGYHLTGVADEGGWGPLLGSNELALSALTEVIQSLELDGKVSIAIDVAASHFAQGDRYVLRSEGRTLSGAEMIDLLASWVERYPVTSIEDGLEEDDWDGWTALTKRLGKTIQLIGDDLFTTNPRRLRQGKTYRAANAVLVKMNQIGTLTETFEVLELADSLGYNTVISARSGETEDNFLADLAVASGAGQIKVGSITRSERLAKYNRLLEMEFRDLFTNLASFQPNLC